MSWLRWCHALLLSLRPQRSNQVPVQLIAATHSPLVMASVEPSFDEAKDGVFHLQLQGGQAVIEQETWAKQGDVVNWLVSPAFGLLSADETLAYEWSNYRFASAWINSSKNRCAAVLDPFDVQPGWFEVLLPSLQLVARKDRIPPQLHAVVDETLKRLHLCDDERIVRQRCQWLRLYEEGKLDFAGLQALAPLIAEAVQAREGL